VIAPLESIIIVGTFMDLALYFVHAFPKMERSKNMTHLVNKNRRMGWHRWNQTSGAHPLSPIFRRGNWDPCMENEKTVTNLGVFDQAVKA